MRKITSFTCGTVKKDTEINSLIILAFALAHAFAALVFGLFHIGDEPLLTFLTMAMIAVLCIRKNLKIEITAAFIILANIIGFFIGTKGGILLHEIIGDQTAASTLATFITTIILGCGTTLIAKALALGNSNLLEEIGQKPQVMILVVAFLMIFLLRMLIFAFSSTGISQWTTFEIFSMILSNSAVMVTLICLDIIFIRFSGQLREEFGHSIWWFILVLFILITSQLSAYIVSLSPQSHISPDLSPEFLQLCILCIIMGAAVYSIIYLINYSLETQQAIRAEKEKRHYAQFRYEKLKQQVNPHFLFNSLNVLDSLIVEGMNEDASEYIRKLAGLYRYMLQNEDKRLVSLSEEMEFVDAYIDLMHTRFPKGFEVSKALEDADLEKMVPPCSVQMLVENIFKHNAVSETAPLHIAFRSDGQALEVKNNIVPRKGKSPSTGVGQNYIKQQYIDLKGGDVVIRAGKTEYLVRLPLIDIITITGQ